MASQRRRTKVTYANIKQMERIEMLLAKPPEHISMITGVERKVVRQPEISKKEQKSKMLESSKVKYAYSKGSKIIHDKTCSHVEGIKLDNLRVSKEYIPTMSPCPECKINAYIREGGDFGHKSEYMSFFKRANFDERHIRGLFITVKAKTQISGDVMTIKTKDDIWTLRIIEEEEYGLELLKGDLVIRKWISAEEAIHFIKNRSWKSLDDMVARADFKNRVKRWYIYVKRDIYRKIRNFKRLNGCMRVKSVYYIDGDNDPERRILGIEDLSRHDVVKIFCANNNSHYSHYKRRESLQNRCKCKIKFIPVMPGPDAVDFAIGIDAYGTYMKKPRRNIFLLSGDKHFTVIKRQIDILSNGLASVRHISMISEVI